MRPDHEQAVREFDDEGRRRNLSRRTLVYRRRIALAFLADVGDKPIREVTVQDVRRYLAKRGALVRSTRHEVSVLRAFFAAMLPEDDVLPTDGIKVTLLAPRPPALLSKDGVAKLLAVALDAPARGRGFKAKRLAFALRDRAMLEILYGVGLRAAEVAGARLVDLDLGAGTLLARRVKRGKARLVPLPPSAIPHLARYVREGRPALVHPSNDDEGALLLSLRGWPLGVGDVEALVNKLARLAGVRAHPHAFRRAIASHLVREGASVVAVRELLGHVSLSTTAGYLAVDFDDLRRAVEVLERETQ